MSPNRILLLIIALLSIGFLTNIIRGNPQQTPNATNLWAVGRYEMPRALVQNGIKQADEIITSISEDKYFSFNVCEDYRYFKATVFRNNPGVAYIIYIKLSSGELFSMNAEMEEGTTHIIYSQKQWPVGEHQLILSSMFEGNINPLVHTGYLHLQIVTSNNIQDIMQEITPPPLNEILTISPANHSNFKITNHSNNHIMQNLNHRIAKYVNNNWVPLDDYIGLLSINLPPKTNDLLYLQWVSHENNLELESGRYKLIIQQMSWTWINPSGHPLTQIIPVTVEFEIN